MSNHNRWTKKWQPVCCQNGFTFRSSTIRPRRAGPRQAGLNGHNDVQTCASKTLENLLNTFYISIPEGI